MFQWARGLFSGRSDAVRIAEARAVTASANAIQARYDNAITTDENRRSWGSVDYFSAKAANNYAVRRTLRMRSRYEVANNPFLYGICNSNADDLISTGPTLQVLTSDAGYNREVESAFREWADEVGLTEKLRTAKLARTVDGEGFLVLKTVKDLESPVKLYPCDLEADQVTTPAPTDMAELWVDGLTLHPITGRPTAYHVLRNHPGDWYFPEMNPLKVDKISAKFVLHWFPKFRPGQVRGVPVFTSSLDLFTDLRAYRKAVIGAAEIAADYAAVLEQSEKIGAFANEDEDVEFEAFKRVMIDRKMMTMLPPGAKMNQFDPKQPAQTYEMFQQVCLGEACRPLAYPLNLALGSSQKFNFSSARLDHVNYRGSLRIERSQCETTVLTPMLREWFYEALLAGAVRAFDGVRPPPFEWHWPGFEPLDPAVDAAADHDRLANGTDTWRDYWARRGKYWRDQMAQQAEERGLIEKLYLQFGEPVKRSVTETNDQEAANAV